MESLPDLVAIVAAGVVMLALGLALGLLIGFGRAAKVREGSRAEIEDVELERQKVVRLLEKTKSETRHFTNMMVSMPEFARQINTNHEHAKVAPMIVGILDQMFSPRHIAIFYATEQRGGDLYLAEWKGFNPPGKGTLKIKVGEGRIGWVAEHQVTMELDDFNAHARAKWAAIQEDPAGMRMDLYAPMIHLSREHVNTLYGVLAIGGLEARPPEAKKMIKMIADLGSSAIFNTKLIAEINNKADQDGLTGLFNKRAFKARIGVEIFRCERERSPLSVFILDVDHFKHYNDTNGHLAGDEVLRSVGTILQKTVRSGDIVARYGGEEFIVAMPDTDAEGALEAAQKIRRVIEEFHFDNQEKQPNGNLTISGGIAVMPADGKSEAELIRHADQGLYQSKGIGRNRVQHFEAPTLGDALSFGDESPASAFPKLGGDSKL